MIVGNRSRLIGVLFYEVNGLIETHLFTEGEKKSNYRVNPNNTATG